ncbi:hypothetical protein Neosp_013419 [[Neocosmospora] mangrovei]
MRSRPSMRPLYQGKVAVHLRPGPEEEAKAAAGHDLERLSRMDEINQKIDDLTDMMSRFSPAHASIGDAMSANSPHPPPSPWPQSTLTQTPRTNFQVHERGNNQTLTEADAIEPSLFSQAVFATKFLQAVLAHDIFSPVAPEMTSALKSLGDIVETQQRRNNSYDASNPFSKTLPPGYTIRDLPLPPIGKIMACLRLAKENSRVQSHFLLQFKSLGHFTEYVVKACSPGPMTDAELIIAMYCLQMNKPNAGWAFVSKASLLAQAMGMHSSTAMNSEVTEEKQYKTRLFWGLYCLEKAIALRLGRSSTIRDHDITLPQPLREQRTSPDWFASLPDGIELSRLFGLVFDELFSSSALVQPTSVRRSRAKVLSAKMEQRIASRAVSDMHPEPLGQLIEPKVVAFLRHSNIVCDYSILASIYKSISPEDTSSSSCPECVSAARIALQEHATCISLIADQASEDLILDFWVNTSLLLSPFIPFNILFCNIIETCDSSDLQLLARFVGALELASTIPRYSAACRKQLPIFKSMYDVAAKYIEAKAKVYRQHPSASSAAAGLGIETVEASPSALARTKQSDMPKDASQDDMNDRPDDFGVEMDLSNVELGDWFYQNQQMMRLLEDG